MDTTTTKADTALAELRLENGLLRLAIKMRARRDMIKTQLEASDGGWTTTLELCGSLDGLRDAAAVIETHADQPILLADQLDGMAIRAEKRAHGTRDESRAETLKFYARKVEQWLYQAQKVGAFVPSND